MFAKILCVLLFACQVTLNRSFVTREAPEPVSTESTVLPEGYVTFGQDKFAYKIYEQNSTWEEAKEKCIADGARLPVIDSPTKIEHINTMKTTTNKWIHVGIRQLETTSEWVAADSNVTVSTIPWAEDNPDSAGECAGISVTEIGLVNYPCDWGTEHFACEIPL